MNNPSTRTSFNRILVLALLIPFTNLAHASDSITVAKKAQVNAPAAEVWAFAGKWGEINTLLTMIESVEMDGEHVGSMRVITLPDGGKVHEKMTTRDSFSYSYKFTESPLPVSDFRSKMGVRDLGDGKSEFSWVATMIPNGAPAADVEKLFSDLYDSGIAELQKNFP